MKQFNNYAFIALSAVVLGSAAYVGYRESSNDESSDLLLANIEALARGESYTSWSCDGSNPNTCKARCSKCGVEIEGTGVQKGEHKH